MSLCETNPTQPPRVAYALEQGATLGINRVGTSIVVLITRQVSQRFERPGDALHIADHLRESQTLFEGTPARLGSRLPTYAQHHRPVRLADPGHGITTK